MKLITEYTQQDLEYVTEAVNGKKRYAIEGIFAQSEATNRNGRCYPKPVMEKAIGTYVDTQVKEKRSVGELNHPEGPTINLDKVSHLITELSFQKNDVIGKATVLNTPMGQIVQGLLDGGVRLGVSTRGMGSLVRESNRMVVSDDFVLNTIDIVQDPSAHGAFVNGIMEGVEWVNDNGVFKKSDVIRARKNIAEAGRTYRADVQLREFKNLLNSINKSL